MAKHTKYRLTIPAAHGIIIANIKKSIRRIMLIMDSGDCTDGKRRGFTISKHRKPCGAENDKCAFFRSVIYRGHEAGDHCFKKALLRSFVGYRYAFLHFRRLLT